MKVASMLVLHSIKPNAISPMLPMAVMTPKISNVPVTGVIGV
jgi:hypothetical protein